MIADDEITSQPGDAPELSERILEMRRAFDASFATPRLPPAADVEKMIVVEVGSLKLACRTSQIVRLEPDRKIVPLSFGAPGLVGLAGIRGKLVPVFALSSLLGAPGGGTRWLAIAGRAEPIALAFGRLDRFVRARATDLCPLDGATAAPSHVKEVLRLDAATYHVLDIDSVLTAIAAKASAGQGRPQAGHQG